MALEEKSEALVMAVKEREIEGKCLPGSRRTAWIGDVRRWTEGGLPPTAQRVALDRLSQMRTEKTKQMKTKHGTRVLRRRYRNNDI